MASGPVAAERPVRRLGILAQWSPEGALPGHVRIHLDRLRPHCSRLILVSNSPLDPEAQAAAARLCDRIVERPNKGYDFAAWRDVLLSEDMSQWDEILLTNSSVIGPLFPLHRVFDAMRHRSCDFWAMTGSRSVAPHLQSYFMLFRKSLTCSAIWEKYWSDIVDIKVKKKVIRTYEVNLKRHFEELGFVSDTYIPSMDSPGKRWMLRRLNLPLPIWIPLDCGRADPTIFFPYEIIRRGMPYLKASLVWTHHRRQGCPIEKIKALPEVDYPWHEIGL